METGSDTRKTVNIEMMLRVRFTSACLAAFLVLAPVMRVSANIYSFTDDDGITHFTNLTPSGKHARRYKLYMTTPDERKARPGVIPITAKDRDPARYSRYDASIAMASRTHTIPEPFIRAIIRVESDYDPRVVSVAGAQGLMQLMPATGRRMGVTNPFDPHDYIQGGTRYLRHLANLFNGDMVLTIAGYHAGEGAVRKYGGVPPYQMTHAYINKVLKFYYHYKKQAGG